MSLRRGAALGLGLGVALFAVVVDQFAKGWARDALLDPPRRLALFDFLGLAPAWNRGVSFGFLNGEGGGWITRVILIAGALVVGGLLIRWLAKAERRGVAAAIGFILGGAIGNAIDRARFGAVFDFIDVILGGWHFWTFNPADAAITLGVILLLWDGLFATPRGSK